MSKLNVRIVTFNCGREPIDISTFAKSLSYPSRNSEETPDILVLCLEEVAPIAHAFLGGSFLTPYTTRFVKAVRQLHSEYEIVIAPNLGLTSIMIFAKHDVHAKMQWLETAGVGFGMYEMGNKGAVGVRVGYGSGVDARTTDITFVAAHLAPGEHGVERRNADWKSVVRGLVFRRTKRGRKISSEHDEDEPLLSARPAGDTSEAQSGLFKGSSPVFFAGDLNYRTSDAGPEVSDSQRYPQPRADTTDPLHWSHIRPKDQLDRERKAGRTLHNLEEAEIDFPPTYKYDNKQQPLNKADGSEPDEYVWAAHRWPGWCDRVLYSSFLTDTAMKVSSYTALPLQPTSDHRPVALSFTLDLDAVNSTSSMVKAPFDISKQWRSDRAAARRREILVGSLAYLGLTWEGRALLAATVIGVLGGWLMIRSLVGA